MKKQIYYALAIISITITITITMQGCEDYQPAYPQEFQHYTEG